MHFVWQSLLFDQIYSDVPQDVLFPFQRSRDFARVQCFRSASIGPKVHWLLIMALLLCRELLSRRGWPLQLQLSAAAPTDAASLLAPTRTARSSSTACNPRLSNCSVGIAFSGRSRLAPGWPDVHSLQRDSCLPHGISLHPLTFLDASDMRCSAFLVAGAPKTHAFQRHLQTSQAAVSTCSRR